MPSEEELFRQAGEPPAAAPPEAPVDERRIIPDRPDHKALTDGIDDLHGRRPLTSVPVVKPPGVGEPAKPVAELERIPLPAYLEERERRQNLERELAELRKGQKPPDKPAYDPEEMFSDPKGYTERLTTSLTQAFEQRQHLAELNMDLRLAALQYGDEWQSAWDSYIKHVGEKDEQGRGKHPLDYQRVMNAASPGQEIMAWHRERKYRDEVGNDPAAYRERIRQELLEEMNGTAAPASQRPEPVDDRPRASDGRFQTTRRLPTSLSKAAGGSAAHAEPPDLDGSDDSLWKATASRQRPRRQ